MLHQGELVMDMNFKTKEKDSKDSLQVVQKFVICDLFLFIVFISICCSGTFGKNDEL